MNELRNIIDTVGDAGNFRTLTKALKASGLVDTLKGTGPYTLFAPTDEAFAKLPKHTLDELLEPGNKVKLATLLKYHVVRGKKLAAAIKTTDIETLSGDVVKLNVDAKGIALNKSRVLKSDIQCANGVIHAIDSVSMPPVPQPAR